jgi:hypothetical protein
MPKVISTHWLCRHDFLHLSLAGAAESLVACQKGGELDAAQTLDDPGRGALPLRQPTRVLGMT